MVDPYPDGDDALTRADDKNGDEAQAMLEKEVRCPWAWKVTKLIDKFEILRYQFIKKLQQVKLNGNIKIDIIKFWHAYI